MARITKYEIEEGRNEFSLRLTELEAEAVLALLSAEAANSLEPENEQALAHLLSGDFYKDFRETIGRPTRFHLEDENGDGADVWVGE